VLKKTTKKVIDKMWVILLQLAKTKSSYSKSLSTNVKL